jgi:hypothetical protein
MMVGISPEGFRLRGDWGRRRWSDRFKESGYHTDLSFAKNPPEQRPIPSPELGKVIEQPQLGGLHHCYERRAA